MVLACFLLLCAFRHRQSRIHSVKKALEEMSRRTNGGGPSISLNKMSQDILRGSARSEPHLLYRSLNDINSWNHKSPVLTQTSPNLNYFPRNSAPQVINVQNTPNIGARNRNSSPPILFHNHLHSFDPIPGQVMVQMVPQNSLEQAFRPRITEASGQLGNLSQPVQAELELSHSLGHSYMKMAGAEGITNEVLPVAITPNGPIYRQSSRISRKSLSRGRESQSSYRTSYREDQRLSNNEELGCGENAQAGRQAKYFISKSALPRGKSYKKARSQKKRRKKRRFPSSLSEVRKISSSEEEIEQPPTPRSMYTLKLSPEDSDLGSESYSSSKEKRGATPESEVRARFTPSVRKLKVHKKKTTWSNKDIIKMLTKKMEVTQHLPEEKTRQSRSHRTARKGFVDENIYLQSSSESQSDSPITTKRRENKRAPREKRRTQSRTITQLEAVGTSSSSSDSKSSTESEEDALKNNSLPGGSSISLLKMKQAGNDLSQSLKIPKTFEEYQNWQKSMLDTVAEKYFDKEFLDGGIFDDSSSSEISSPNEEKSQQSEQKSSSESGLSPSEDIKIAKLPSAAVSVGS